MCVFFSNRDLTKSRRERQRRREITPLVHVPNFGGLSGSEGRGGGDNSIQFISFGRVGDKSFEEWRQNIAGWKGG